MVGRTVRAVQEYRGLPRGARNSKLFGLLAAIAQSAYNAGYLLDDGELADLVETEQRHNPPSNPYPYHGLLNKARSAIRTRRIASMTPTLCGNTTGVIGARKNRGSMASKKSRASTT